MTNEYQQKWQQCQQLMRERLIKQYPKNGERIFNTWIAPITFEHYSAEQEKVFFRVPSDYVSEFIDQFYLNAVFTSIRNIMGVKIRTIIWRTIPQGPTHADIAQWLAEHSPYNPKRDPHHIRVENARERLEEEMRRAWGDERFRWMKGYERIAEWLSDNKGKGLLLCAPTGRGKTDICQRILPNILGNGGRPIPYVEAKDLCKPKSADLRDDLKAAPILIVDKLGKEPRKFFSDDNNSFSDLLENAERTGQLLIICTQLSTTTIDPERYPEAAAQYPDSIQNRYGQDVLSRLAAVVKATRIVGEDMRR